MMDKRDMLNKDKKYIVVALYKFVTIENIQKTKEKIEAFCHAHDIQGTILVAHEGLNGTVAMQVNHVDDLIAKLCELSGANEIDHKISYTDRLPFYRMKVKLKKEIVTIGQKDVNPNEKVGTYVNPDEWNHLISDPETFVLDTRNDYEVEIGTFKNAINPKTKTFREFPDYVKKNLNPEKHKRVAMFCTGGIRCEKASSFMMKEGFEEVYHLKGGILKYIEETKAEDSLWDGECFVFDNRVSVNHDLEKGIYEQCYACRNAISAQDMASDKYVKGISCPKCFDQTSDVQKQKAAERQKQCDLANARGETHVGGKQKLRDRLA